MLILKSCETFDDKVGCSCSDDVDDENIVVCGNIKPPIDHWHLVGWPDLGMAFYF